MPEVFRDALPGLVVECAIDRRPTGHRWPLPGHRLVVLDCAPCSRYLVGVPELSGMAANA